MRLLALLSLLAPVAFGAEGGPDAAGYVYTDSLGATNAPSHAWLDTTEGATAGELTLPFTFTFYGTDYDSVTLSEDGALLFAGTAAACPASTNAWTGIAAFAADLTDPVLTTGTFGIYPYRTFVVSWEAEATVQAWLLEGRDEVVIVWDDLGGLTGATGVASAAAGLPYDCASAIADDTSAWFGDEQSRPAREEIYTAELEDPWSGEATAAYAGRALAVGDLDGDDVDDFLVGDQDYLTGLAYAVYRPDLSAVLSGADASFTGDASSERFGAALTIGDLDGDDVGEVFVGAPDNADAGSKAGATFLFTAPYGAAYDTGDAYTDLRGPTGTQKAQAGSSFDLQNDVDGDGYLDLVVGAPGADGGAVDSGAVYLLLGGSLPSGTNTLGTIAATFTGSSSTDAFGTRVLTGDTDDDGAAEIVVGAPTSDTGASNAGRVFIFPGGSYGVATYAASSAATCTLVASSSNGNFGDALALGDFDDSGLLDLAIGAPKTGGSLSNSGATYVIADGDCPSSLGDADAVITGDSASSYSGSTLSAGDLDGDGVDDLVVGAPNQAGIALGGGAGFVFSDPSGSLSVTDADHVVYGSESAGQLTTAQAIADDGDGTLTWIATAPYADVGATGDGGIYQWTPRGDFEDDDSDRFINRKAGGNDCDDEDASAYPGGTDADGDSIDGDCDGWIDGVIRERDDDDEFHWDVLNFGGTTTSLDFESYALTDTIGTYEGVTFSDGVADDVVDGSPAGGEVAAAIDSGIVTLTFDGDIDSIALRILDPSDDFTLSAANDAGTVVDAYDFELRADNRSGGLYRGWTFIEPVTTLTLSTATGDGFGLDDLDVAWAVDSDRDLDAYTDAAGDCDDADAAIHPAAEEILGNGIDDNCDDIVDGGDATTMTDAEAWADEAGIDPEQIDFEDLAEGLTVDDQYLSLGADFGASLTVTTDVDGTAPNDTRGGIAGSAGLTLTFTEVQPAVGFTLLDADVLVTIEGYVDGELLYTSLVSGSGGSEFVGLLFDYGVDELRITGAGDDLGADDVIFSVLGLDDSDGDGKTEKEGDCDDTSSTTYEGAEETWYDGVDSDCAGDDDYDADRDGFDVSVDCDDEDDTTNPDAEETYYDGVDSDCSGDSDFDVDGDGETSADHGGTDCDDEDDAINTGATDTWYDGIDSDCAGNDDYDADGDGYPTGGGSFGEDCDDGDASVSPGAEESYYDGVDSDCSGAAESDYDQDGDGYDSLSYGGDDCDDLEPTAYPGATGDECYDGIDTDCDGGNEYDCDRDGYDAEDHGGEDCDDTDDAVNPGVADPAGTAEDENCDGGPEFDDDGDGFDAVADGGTDCDDTDATIYVGAEDVCYDGIDHDCGGEADYDCDGDGHDSDGYGGDDCNDATAAIHPDADDFPYDGIDHDCAGDEEYDVDGDGFLADWYGGEDCDDTDGAVFPGAADTCYDGVDQDCLGDDDYDCDADGYALGEDCADDDAAISPEAAEVADDGIDQDCDGADLAACTDCDGDGFEADAECDDTRAWVYPGADDTWYDGTDADCDGADDFDQDGDGDRATAWGGTDCDDADATVSPAATTDGCGRGDEDCDGEADEDCDDGEDDTGDTAVIDTGDSDDTGDSADSGDSGATDWRPDADETTEPTKVVTPESCGCASGGSLAGVWVLAAGAVAMRRRLKPEA